jgi:hypothetical protein
MTCPIPISHWTTHPLTSLCKQEPTLGSLPHVEDDTSVATQNRGQPLFALPLAPTPPASQPTHPSLVLTSSSTLPLNPFRHDRPKPTTTLHQVRSADGPPDLPTGGLHRLCPPRPDRWLNLATIGAATTVRRHHLSHWYLPHQHQNIEVEPWMTVVVEAHPSRVASPPTTKSSTTLSWFFCILSDFAQAEHNSAPLLVPPSDQIGNILPFLAVWALVVSGWAPC